MESFIEHRKFTFPEKIQPCSILRGPTCHLITGHLSCIHSTAAYVPCLGEEVRSVSKDSELFRLFLDLKLFAVHDKNF